MLHQYRQGVCWNENKERSSSNDGETQSVLALNMLSRNDWQYAYSSSMNTKTRQRPKATNIRCKTCSCPPRARMRMHTEVGKRPSPRIRDLKRTNCTQNACTVRWLPFRVFIPTAIALEEELLMGNHSTRKMETSCQTWFLCSLSVKTAKGTC